MAFDPSFAPTQLAARAAYLLRGNDLGVMTSAAPLLYPHMWSWDAAFVSIGLASLTVERAVVELDTLLSAQWANGMIPHIVFANGVDGYFPGPARWETAALAVNAPRSRETSGITQPPVHAIAVQRILDHARTRGRSTRVVAEAFLDRRWDDLVRAQWPRSRWRLAALTLGTTVRMAGNGSLWRMLQTSWPAFLALTLPALSLLVPFRPRPEVYSRAQFIPRYPKM